MREWERWSGWSSEPPSGERASDEALELTPHHAWERGTNENTNGRLRQYLPKRTSMAHVTQHDCQRIAKKLNTRPRKRYDYDTPEERFHAA